MMGVGAVLSARLISRELDVVRMKTDFAANVSHELRSPITQIRLKAESLILGLAETPEEIEAHYNIVLRESERLSRLVDNILDYAAIERGSKQYILRQSNIAETVYRAIESVRSTLELKDIELTLDVPYDLPPVHHDTDAITQCIVNLVSNAAKYSPGGSEVRVHARLVEGVELTVSDDGIGIAPHDLRKIFDPFYRSRDSLARRQKGTGIGLTITRYIIEAHGGSISVQSRPGKGSTFTLRFPTQPPPTPSLTTI
jgi:signal transduction histidine kinase